MLKEHTPGAFTFILPAGKQTPKLLFNKSKTVGIRVPDNAICNAIVALLGHPIVSTSIPLQDGEDYLNDPEIIYERFSTKVDAIIDAGISGIEYSTVIDCTISPPKILRQGLGLYEE
jgi:tRNA threonylcarbamoyl adenosine modification protein (Sua5/YciO/YrdC/YwlC family)